tara:strand:- start:374 stop:628 length:255 start_codon:yes stop_codon:yes gene_type:complete
MNVDIKINKGTATNVYSVIKLYILEATRGSAFGPIKTTAPTKAIDIVIKASGKPNIIRKIIDPSITSVAVSTGISILYFAVFFF